MITATEVTVYSNISASAATITASANKVSQWDDKSASGYDLVQPTGSAQPSTNVSTINSLNVITNNTFTYLRQTVSITGDLTVLAVCKTTNLTTSNRVLTSLLRANSTAAGDRDLQIDQDGTSFRSIAFDGAAKIATRPKNGNANIFTTIVDYGTAVTFILNGDTSATTAIGSRPATSVELRVGASNSFTTGWQGDIAELIYVNEALTATDYQKAEGYLAHKWGLTSQLPIGHPYKTTAP
jgi:hypothetical protein